MQLATLFSIGITALALSGCAQPVQQEAYGCGKTPSIGMILGAFRDCSKPQEFVCKGECPSKQLPPGYGAEFYQDSKGLDSTYLPAGQSLWRTWTEGIIDKVEPGSKAPSATQFAETIARDRPRGCSNKVVDPAVVGTVNGFPSATVKSTCTAFGNDPNRSETLVVRAIRGERGAYATTYIVRSTVDDQKLASMMQYLDTFSVCNVTLTGHPCPQEARR
jgi:hypothetical protein